MKIILLERVPNLGLMGDVVTVKPGYARNFLLPHKKAQRATKENIAHFETQRKHLEATNIARRDEAQAVAGRMSDVHVTVIRSASEAGHLYGSVRSTDIAAALKESGYTVARNQVEVLTPIKTLGAHSARVILHPEVSVSVGVLVARSSEEAELQLAALKEPKSSESADNSEDTSASEDRKSAKRTSRKAENGKSAVEAIIAEISGPEEEK